MIVYYYGIPNCRPETVQGAPALTAPPDAEEFRLKALGFQQMPDGTWYHILSAEEHALLCQPHDPEKPVIFGAVPAPKPPEIRQAERLCVLTVLLTGLCPILLSVSGTAEMPFRAICWVLAGVSLLTALVLAVHNCVSHPTYKDAKKTLTVLVVLLLIIACVTAFCMDIGGTHRCGFAQR